MDIKNCTRCNKELTDLKIEVMMKIGVERKKSSEVWENIPNLNQMTREILCEECFEKFADTLQQMSVPHNKEKE